LPSRSLHESGQSSAPHRPEKLDAQQCR
jgi:hypothetical protein